MTFERKLLGKVLALSLLSLPHTISAAEINVGNSCTTASACADAIRSALENGDDVYFPNGTYNVASFHLTGLNNVNIRGQSKSGVTINTNQFWITASGDISVSELSFVGVKNDYTNAPSAILAFKEARSLTFTNNNVKDAAEEGLSVSNIGIFNINDNSFDGTGQASRIKGSNGEISGTAIGIAGTSTGNGIEKNEIKNNDLTKIDGIGVWIDAHNVKNLTIDDTNVTNGVYGTGIYIKGDDSAVLEQTQNITITGSIFKNFTINGIRINGTNIDANTNIFDGGGTVAIKAHFLANSEINNNTITLQEGKTSNGITLYATSPSGISNVNVTDNKTERATIGLKVSYEGSGSYTNVKAMSNTFRNSIMHGIYFKGSPSNPATNSLIVLNTVSNSPGMPFTRSAIHIASQADPVLDKNWIYGQSASGNYAHIYLENMVTSRLLDNTIISPNCVDKDYGGIMFNNANASLLTGTNFTNLTDPAVHQPWGQNNAMPEVNSTYSYTSCYY